MVVLYFLAHCPSQTAGGELISPAKQLNNPHGLHILKRETLHQTNGSQKGRFVVDLPIPQWGNLGLFQSFRSTSGACCRCHMPRVANLGLPLPCIIYINILTIIEYIMHHPNCTPIIHPFSSIWSSLFWLQCHAPHSRQPFLKGLKIGALWSQRLMPLRHSTKLRDHTGLEDSAL